MMKPGVAATVTVAWALVAAGCNGEAKKAEKPKGPRPVAVRAEPVRTGSLTLSTEYPGELFADSVDVAPRTSGTLVEVAVRLGDAVKAGQVVARVDDAQVTHQLQEAKGALLAAEANMRRAEATLQLAKTEVARKAPLAKDQLVSAQEMSELKARVQSLEAEVNAAAAQTAQARARLGLLEEQRSDTRLIAPFDGTVSERRLDPGATVGPTTPVVRVVAAGPAQVRFRVPERDLAAVREGLQFQVRTAATGDKAFEGRVVRMGTEVSRTDRAVQVEGVLSEESPVLRPGMYATVVLQKRTLEDQLLVPAVALVRRQLGAEETTGVFVALNGQADWRPVELLGQEGMTAAVKGALEVGERVLTLGHEELAPGSPIRVVGEKEMQAKDDAGGQG